MESEADERTGRRARFLAFCMLRELSRGNTQARVARAKLPRTSEGGREFREREVVIGRSASWSPIIPLSLSLSLAKQTHKLRETTVRDGALTELRWLALYKWLLAAYCWATSSSHPLCCFLTTLSLA